MRSLYFLLFLFVLSGCEQMPMRETVVTSDVELQRLNEKLSSTTTQTDMNLASMKISEFWDTRLALVEQKVEKKLEDAEQKKYSDAKARWRVYRTAEVKFRASLFEGGSIQPLVANQSYSDITQDRVTELESVLANRP